MDTSRYTCIIDFTLNNKEKELVNYINSLSPDDKHSIWFKCMVTSAFDLLCKSKNIKEDILYPLSVILLNNHCDLDMAFISIKYINDMRLRNDLYEYIALKQENNVVNK